MEKIAGIDFGTTYSRIAFIQDGRPFLIPFQNGSGLLPSLVLYTPSQAILVGEKAKENYFQYPKSSILHVKRYLGQNFQFHLNDRIFSAEELSSYIFRELKYQAEIFLKEKIEKAVVTVPTYFNHFQREATIQAAQCAGWKVLQLLNEPTAAALAYRCNQGQNSQKIMICDLGGGTFDVSVLDINQENFKVKSTSGDPHLGGMDWDRALYRFFEHKLHQEFDKKALSTAFVRDKLWKSCEKLKETLSFQEQAILSTPIIVGHAGFLKNYTYKMSRQEFADMTRHLIGGLEVPLKQALSSARISSTDLDRVILVGGSTFIPQVRYFLETFLGVPIEAGVNPEKVVAMGAAIYSTQSHLQEVTPLSLSVKSHKQGSSMMIKKNTPLPITQTKRFKITGEDPASFDVYVYQGKKEIPNKDYLIGKISLKKFLLNPNKEQDIEVTFFVDVSGRISVFAKELTSQEELEVILENTKTISYQK